MDFMIMPETLNHFILVWDLCSLLGDDMDFCAWNAAYKAAFGDFGFYALIMDWVLFHSSKFHPM